MHRTLIVISIAGATCLLGAHKDPERRKPDKDVIQGDWTIIAAERNGVPENFEKELQVFFRGDKTGLKLGEKTANEARFKLLPDQKPKGIDLWKEKDDRVAKGVYSLSGDTLKLCLPGGPNRDRPKELTTKLGDGFTLLTLRRTQQKPEE
jgi:uncharacterized protein (TIGR03067 family)